MASQERKNANRARVNSYRITSELDLEWFEATQDMDANEAAALRGQSGKQVGTYEDEDTGELTRVLELADGRRVAVRSRDCNRN